VTGAAIVYGARSHDDDPDVGFRDFGKYPRHEPAASQYFVIRMWAYYQQSLEQVFQHSVIPLSFGSVIE
jgi:hypothetical protein